MLSLVIRYQLRASRKGSARDDRTMLCIPVVTGQLIENLTEGAQPTMMSRTDIGVQGGKRLVDRAQQDICVIRATHRIDDLLLRHHTGIDDDGRQLLRDLPSLQVTSPSRHCQALRRMPSHPSRNLGEGLGRIVGAAPFPVVVSGVRTRHDRCTWHELPMHWSPWVLNVCPDRTRGRYVGA